MQVLHLFVSLVAATSDFPLGDEPLDQLYADEGVPAELQALDGLRSGDGSAAAAQVQGVNWGIGKFCNFLQNFGGLVLGCIKTKFYKKICVRQHFSSSTRFASFCTAAISKIS